MLAGARKTLVADKTWMKDTSVEFLRSVVANGPSPMYCIYCTDAYS